MAEHLEEFESEDKFDLGRYVRVVRRRQVLFLATVLVVWLCAWGASWLLAPRYKSGTLILVEQPTMPTNYVAPNVSDNLQDRLQTITQQILSRTRLLKIIDKLHLYQPSNHAVTPDQEVRAMRKDISVKVENDTRTGAITAFNIYYTAPNPKLAQTVTTELSNLFINENNEVRQQQSEETTQFLKNQLATAKTQLAEQDANVRMFRSAHPGQLPSQEASNLQILSGLQSQLLSDENALSTAQQQQVYAQSLLGEYQRNPTSTSTPGGQPSDLAAINQHLTSLREKLNSLRTRYTDQYPEVQSVRTEIARTEKQQQQWVASHGNSKAQSGSASNSTTAGTHSIASAPMLQLESQLQASKAEVANRQRAIANLKQRINQYQARLNDEPAVQQQLADLTRGYQQSQTNYDNLLKKVQESQMATSMEQMQQGQRFKVLDPPSLPLRPDFPNRLKFSVLGLFAGIILGVLAMVGAEVLDDRLYGDHEIEKVLSIPVISEVPEIETASDKKRNQRLTFFRWAMTGLVAIAIVAGTAVSYLHP